jgi:hypothetical protein
MKAAAGRVRAVVLRRLPGGVRPRHEGGKIQRRTARKWHRLNAEAYAVDAEAQWQVGSWLETVSPTFAALWLLDRTRDAFSRRSAKGRLAVTPPGSGTLASASALGARPQ